MKINIQEMCIAEKSSIREVLETIDQGALGIALLVDPVDQRFRGLISDGDIRRALLGGLGLSAPAKKVKRPETVVASIDMSIDEIAAMFSDPVRIVPILNSDKKVVDLALFDKRANLPVAEPKFGEKELKYVSECILTGWVSSAGKFVKLFENQFAEFCETRHAVSCNSGTSALHLSLLAAGIGTGDEVIVPALTFIATANAVTFTGAKPVFVDSEPANWNIDPDLIERAITKKTRAIIPVHLYGHPADMDPILALAKKYNLVVIEDAAEAHGATYKGEKVGSLGHMGIFSFYGNKIITTGEGGMVATNDAGYEQKMRVLRDHGMDSNKRYWHPVLGYNYRLTNIQAALGVAQMERLEAILARKRLIAKAYTKNLEHIEGIKVPGEASWARSVYWLYSILVDRDGFGMSRDRLMQELANKGIETRPVFLPIHLQPIYPNNQKLPIAENISDQGLSLPSSASLSTDEIAGLCQVILSIRNGEESGPDRANGNFALTL